LAEDQDFSARLNHLDEDVEMTSGSMMDAMHFGGDRSRQESFGGSKPISMMNNPHRDASGVRFRESLTGSHIAGTSISLSRTPFLGSSWVRDNVLPSSFTQHQSPSNHSSSYQPKLEANYLSNFLCCGKEIRNLHDLLQHYEDTHAGAAVNGFSQLNGFQPQQPRSRPTPSGLAPSDQFVGQSHLSPNHGLHPFSAAQQQQQQQRSTSHISRDQRHLAMTANMDDMDTVGEMDMDDAVGHMELDDGMSGQRRARQIFGQQQNRSSLSINGPSGLSQALRGSQPPTPGAPNFGLQHDPTVASVNTPTLSTQAQQQHQAQQQQLDQAFMQEAVANMGHNGAGAFGGMGLGNGFGNGIANFGNLNFAATALNNSSDFCINDPAKALFSPGNPHPNNNGNLFGDTPAGRNLQHQLMQSMNLSVQGLQSHPQKALLQQLGPMMLRDEDKPHKCPVVGCDKAYKNSNGLKYHKSHGHLNQQLHDNGDGTFSIINPETSTPYPGTEGMEKEKPFSCELCNKRYKNPNGLKYHRLHSDCNPELRIKKLQELQAAGLPAAMNLFPDGLVEGMPNGMVNGLDGGMGGGLDGGLASGLHTPMTEHMDDMDMSDIIAG
jgi:transcription factor SFP1